MNGANKSITRTERAGRLVRRAMTLFETDRRAAWRCLGIASTLLTVEPGVIHERSLDSERAHGLAKWQTKRVIEYIESNIESKLGIDQLARLAAVSRGHFSRAFKQRVGLTPMSYVAMRRVECTKAMVTSSRESLTEIAVACGFNDQPHLTRWFRRVVGITPGQYRRINCGLAPSTGRSRTVDPALPPSSDVLLLRPEVFDTGLLRASHSEPPPRPLRPPTRPS